MSILHGLGVTSQFSGMVAVDDDWCSPLGLMSNLLSMTYVQVSAFSGSQTLGDVLSSM